jgi:hypothetical protein
MGSYTDIFDLNDHPDIAKALGNMVLAWAGAESAMLYAMCAICGITTDMGHFGYYRIPTFEARV